MAPNQPPISLDNLDDEPVIAAEAPPSPEAASEDPPPPRQTASEEPEVDEHGEPEADAQSAPDSSLPRDLKEGFQMLAQADAMPARNKKEQAIKEARIDQLRKHVSAMQQGLPTVTLGADDLAASQEKERKQIKRQRIELLARQNLEVADLLKERNALAAELEMLKKR